MEHLKFRPLRSGVIRFKDDADRQRHDEDCTYNIALGEAMHLASLSFEERNALWKRMKEKRAPAYMELVAKLGQELKAARTDKAA